MMPFGYELLVDVYGVSRKRCDDLSKNYHFLVSMIDVLGVEAQSPPFIFRTDASLYPEKAGLSGWIPLVESGIQLHTLTPKRFVSVDVYSCRAFNSDTVLRHIAQVYPHSAMEHQVVQRGRQYDAR